MAHLFEASIGTPRTPAHTASYPSNTARKQKNKQETKCWAAIYSTVDTRNRHSVLFGRKSYYNSMPLDPAHVVSMFFVSNKTETNAGFEIVTAPQHLFVLLQESARGHDCGLDVRLHRVPVFQLRLLF